MLSGAMFDEASRRQKIMQFSFERMQRRLELVTPQLCLDAADPLWRHEIVLHGACLVLWA